VVYNLVLEPMVLGGLLPAQSIPVGVLAFACVLAAVWGLEPMLRRMVWGPFSEVNINGRRRED